jgi:glycolate oxidase
VPLLLQLEYDGHRHLGRGRAQVEEVAEEIHWIDEIMNRNGATEIKTSRDEPERLRFWAGRKAAFPAAGRISPDYYCMDGTIPRKKLAKCWRSIERSRVWPALRERFHAGMGIAPAHPL